MIFSIVRGTHLPFPSGTLPRRDPWWPVALQLSWCWPSRSQVPLVPQGASSQGPGSSLPDCCWPPFGAAHILYTNSNTTACVQKADLPFDCLATSPIRTEISVLQPHIPQAPFAKSSSIMAEACASSFFFSRYWQMDLAIVRLWHFVAK